MRSTTIGSFAAILTAFALAPAANAQFSDNFDSYTAGTPIEGNNGWEFWYGCGTNTTHNTVEATQAFSAPHSLSLAEATPGSATESDTVNQMNGPYDMGAWTFTAMTYVPNGFTGDGYIIMNDAYDSCAGTASWSVQTHFNGASGELQSDTFVGALTPVNGNPLIQYDTWVEFRIEFDFDLGTYSSYYDGVEMYIGMAPQIVNLDLYNPAGCSEWFIDDISMEPNLMIGPIGTNYCMAAPNSTGSAGTVSAFGSANVGQNDVTLTAADLPANQFGIFVTSMTQAFVPGAGGTSNGNLCLGGSLGRFSQPNQILNSGSGGEFSLALDLAMFPQGAGFVPVAAGETWSFQAWYRDPVGVGSNFTEGIEIPFL